MHKLRIYIMKRNTIKSRFYPFAFLVCLLAFSSCDGFLYDDSEQVIFTDDHRLDSDADTLWTLAGIMNKMQAIADRTVLLGELRGDLVDLTDNASADLRDIANFNIGDANVYNRPSDYYAIINNCNFYLAKADTALRDNRNEFIFMKEYAAVKAFRAWTYLQLVLNYGRVPLITQPVLSTADSQQDFPLCGIQEICDYFISDIAPYANIETPGYGSIRSTDSKLFYFPIYVLLGDLNLWAGNYRAAAENYYKYISTRNGSNSAYPLSTNSVRFSQNDSHWRMTMDTWSIASFFSELRASTSELITMIPGDSIPSEGNYSRLRDLFNTTENNEYKASIVPSQALIDLSASQKYCHFTSGGEFVQAPDNLTGFLKGDLRLRVAYSVDEGTYFFNGKRVENYASFSKYMTRNVHVYRRATVYLRLAEALNRAGYPRFAFQILKQGVNNNVIENEVIPYYEADADWIRTFDFPNILYVLETTAGMQTENTTGLHSRGCGYSAYNDAYVLPDDSTITDSLARRDYQIERVEELIVDEEALELAFEGQRFYDLMRVALRRNSPAFLADRVYARKGNGQRADIQTDLTDPQSWYMQWNGKIGFDKKE